MDSLRALAADGSEWVRINEQAVRILHLSNVRQGLCQDALDRVPQLPLLWVVKAERAINWHPGERKANLKAAAFTCRSIIDFL